MAEQIGKEYIRLKKQALERYFDRMNDMQKRAVFHTDGPLLILAGAGSGKTTVLIGRIENMARFGGAYNSDYVPAGITGDDISLLENYVKDGGAEIERITGLLAERPVRPWNILAITFTNKAAGELKSRLEERLGSISADIWASTFHSLCVRILRREIEAIGYGRNFTIYDSDDSLRVIKDGLRMFQIDEKMLAPRTVLSYISRTKDEMKTPPEMAEASKNDYRLASVAKVYDYYQNTLKSANALDFDDIIVNTVRLFEARPDILEYYQNRFQYIMVDEYQDTNRTQYRLISLLAAKHGNLCVVGDDDQSIYKFRGATIENILSFESQFKNTEVIRLERNYRSTQNILSAANGLIANNTARKGKNLWTSAGDGDKVSIVRVRDEMEESRFIADEILSHVKNGGKYSDNAVLYRINAQSNSLEKALASNAIPYRIISGLRFYERKEIKDIVSYLSVIENPGDILRLTRIINEPKRGIGDSTLQAAREISEAVGETLFEVICRADEYAPLSRKCSTLMEFGKMMRSLAGFYEENGLDGLLDEILEKTGYLAYLKAQGFEGETRIENVMELKTNILKYVQDNEEPSLAGFLEEIALYSDTDNYDKDADAVVLMTIHSAKGLEFENVFIAGMEDGIFPGRMSMLNPAEIEEERRLAYVAVTRAKRRLALISASSRMLFGQTMWGRPSRFTGEIPAEYAETADKTAVPKPKAPRLASAVVGGKSSRSIGVSAGTASQGKAGGSMEFAKGDAVLHKVFGEGTVLDSKPMGGDLLVEIDFGAQGVKRLMANFARLVKI